MFTLAGINFEDSLLVRSSIWRCQCREGFYVPFMGPYMHLAAAIPQRLHFDHFVLIMVRDMYICRSLDCKVGFFCGFIDLFLSISPLFLTDLCGHLHGDIFSPGSSGLFKVHSYYILSSLLL